MVLIEELNIREFRGIRETVEPIRFSKFNVLVGRNNSGKSAVLEALALFPFPIDSIVLPIVGKTRLDLISSLHSGRSALIYGYAGFGELKYRVNGKFIRFLISDGGITSGFIDGEKIQFSSFIEEIPRVIGEGLSLDEINSLVAFIPNDSGFLVDIYKGVIGVWDELMKGGANIRIVKDFVSRVVHDEFTEIFLGRQDKLLLRKVLPDERVFWIKVEDLGDGVERIVLTALYLEALQPKLVLWDDFEVSAHPGLIRATLEWLSGKDWQIVLSTHSIDVIREVIRVDPEGAQFILLRSDESDRVHVRYFDVDEMDEVLDSNVDARLILDLI